MANSKLTVSNAIQEVVDKILVIAKELPKEAKIENLTTVEKIAKVSKTKKDSENLQKLATFNQDLCDRVCISIVETSSNLSTLDTILNVVFSESIEKSAEILESWMKDEKKQPLTHYVGEIASFKKSKLEFED